MKRAPTVEQEFPSASAGGVVRRTGFTMLELTVAAGVLGTVFVVIVPVLSRVRDTRELAQQRFYAQQEAANVMERVALRSANGKLPEVVEEAASVSPEVLAVLPDAAISVTHSEHADDAGLVRVTVAISWIGEAGERFEPVALDAWFPVGEDQP